MTTEIDLSSPTWKAISARATARIDALRARNDGPLDEIKTAHLRGQVRELKELLALADPAHMADEAQQAPSA